jgi:hypothetical protein
MGNSMNPVIKSLFIFYVLGAATLVAAQQKASILESDWLNTNVGSTGDKMGAKVIRVTNDPGKDSTTVDILLPVENADEYDGIVVIGKDSKQPIKQVKDPEWLEQDYQKNEYGLRLYLKKEPGFQFRLRLIDNEGINTYDPIDRDNPRMD